MVSRAIQFKQQRLWPATEPAAWCPSRSCVWCPFFWSSGCTCGTPHARPRWRNRTTRTRTGPATGQQTTVFKTGKWQKSVSRANTHLGRNQDHWHYLIGYFAGRLVRRTVRDEYVVYAEQRDQDQRGPDRLPDADWRGVGGVPVQFGEQHPHHVHQEQQAGQYGREHRYGQHPLAVALVHPTPAETQQL